MPRLLLSRSLCLVGLCGLWSCGKQEAPVTAATPAFEQSQTPAPNQPAAVQAAKPAPAAPDKPATPSKAVAANGQAPAAAAANAPASPAPQIITDENGRKTARVTSEQAAQLADGLMARGQFQQAFQILSELIRIDSKNTAAYVKRAAILAESRQLALAVTDMTSALNLKPDDAKLLNTRGFFQLSQNNLDEAEKDFQEAIRLNPSFTQAINNLGLTKVRREQFAESVQNFDEALKLDPKYVDAHNNRGYALQMQDKLPEAIEAYTKAIELNPKYENSWHNRGTAYMKNKEAEKALSDFTEAHKLSPGHLPYIAARADAFAAMGKDKEARDERNRLQWLQTLAILTQKTQQTPDQPSVWIARGRHLLASGEKPLALSDFNTAIKLAPENEMARCGRAVALMSLGKKEEAIAECNVVLSKGLSPQAISIRGDVYFSMGDLDKALEDYSHAKRLDSHVASVHRQRAEKLKAAGMTAEAEADLAAALKIDQLKDMPTENKVQQVSAEIPVLDKK